MTTTRLTQEEVEQRLADLSGEKVTPEYIDKRIWRVQYSKMDKTTTTLCVITLDNHFTVTGTSACVDPDNFDFELGKTTAYDNAYKQLWPLFGFLLCEKRHLANGVSEQPLADGVGVCAS